MAKKKAAKRFHTIAAVAKELGVGQRTVSGWLAMGAPGREADGYDPTAIAVWRDESIGGPGVKPSSIRDRYQTAQAAREELKLQRERGELIEVEVAASIVAQHAAEVRSHLEQFPEFAASLVKLAAKKRKLFLDRMAAKVRELCAIFERSAVDLAEAAEK